MNFGFKAKLLVVIAFLLLLVSCHSASGPDFKKDKELRLQVKLVMPTENEAISIKDIGEMLDQTTIRRGGLCNHPSNLIVS